MARYPDASEFAQLAAGLHAASTPQRTAAEIIRYACTGLDADEAGITLIHARGRLQTLAPTAPAVTGADALQSELGEGPCLDSSPHAPVQACRDLRADHRWPRWSARVTALGIRSALIAELTSAAERRLGSINLYWANPRSLTADEIAFANTFARHAALALAQSVHEADLRLALESRTLIGQAQGILMERYSLDAERAFEVLRRYSQDHNIKLRHVADILVSRGDFSTLEGCTEPPGSPPRTGPCAFDVAGGTCAGTFASLAPGRRQFRTTGR